jgi:hypothetical protein
VYERVPGSGVWWIRWTDSNGKLHREKVGRRSDAITLIAKRRTEAIQKKKLPEKFRVKITFNSLCDDAIEHSKATNNTKVTHDLELKVAKLRPAFGTLDAATITKQDVVRWLTAEAETRQGAALQNAKGWFDAAIKEAKIERYTWHCNRHTFASRLVMRGINLRTIGELLGHRTMAMTMRYSHLSPAHNAAAVDSLVTVSVMPTGTTTDTSKKAVARLKTEVA